MIKRAIVVLTMVMAVCSGVASATTHPGDLTPRKVPSHDVPVPTDVSPELQQAIARPLPEAIHTPKDAAGWRQLIDFVNTASVSNLEKLRAAFPMSVASETMGGVKVYVVTPKTISPDSQKRILVHLHGGGFVFNGGDSAVGEAILMAHYGQIKVISVDYRMPPEHPFPAALDDVVTVWKEILKKYSANNAGLFGTSAGGGLTLSTVHKLKSLRLPLPGAIAAGTPWVDLSGNGDSFYSHLG